MTTPFFRDTAGRALTCGSTFLFLLALVVNGAPSAPEPSPAIDVFILAGQSNMAGADSVVTDPAGFVLTDADREALFTCAPAMEGSRSPRYYPWGIVKGHFSKSEKISHGPEVGFERRLYEAGNRRIALIKVWANFGRTEEGWPWAEGGKLFVPWMAFVDDRLEELRQRGFKPRVRGFIWHQGIDDAIHGALAAHYEENLTALIATLRRRFDAPLAPFVLARSVDSPIARGLTGSGPNDPMATVRRAQVAVATHLPRVGWISVDDLPNVVQHHFSAESQMVIGRRFADAFLALESGAPKTSGK